VQVARQGASASRQTRLDATVVDRRIGGIAAAGTDADAADPVGIHVRKRRHVVDHRADVFRPDVGVFQLARFAGALSLIGSVERNRDEPVPRQLQPIETRRLLLNATPRVRHNDGRILLAFIKSIREE
jgi:hypothetical protein